MQLLLKIIWREILKWNGDFQQHMDTCIQQKITIRRQTILTSKKNKDKFELTSRTYDLEIANKELGSAIMMHEYSLSIVDHVSFKRYSSTFQLLFKVLS